MGKTIAALMFIFLSATAVPAMSADTVYVMRHLHKAAGDDPPLTEEGGMLARMVAGLLGPDDFNVTAVFATKTRRAMQTGEPLARMKQVPLRNYDPRDVPALVQQVKALPGAVLIVGHSNTVPDLVAAFGGAKPKPLTDTDYGAIYQVTVATGGVREFYVPTPPRLLSPAPERGR